MITAKLLRDWGTCINWPDTRIVTHFKGRSSVSPRDVATDESIDLDDRLWVLCRALWYRSESAARTFAIDSAALASHLAGNERDQAEHARLVEDLRRIYSLPAVERTAELGNWNAARSAARSAAWDAARSAAWDTARSAAWDAARSAAWSAARSAARSAAWDAARSAAWTVARNAIKDAARNPAWNTTYDDELRKAIARALTALGSDADGWVS